MYICPARGAGVGPALPVRALPWRGLVAGTSCRCPVLSPLSLQNNSKEQDAGFISGMVGIGGGSVYYVFG